MSGYRASQFITPFTNKPVTTSDETLLSILDLTSSSHTPIYVIDDKDYKGVVSVFQTMNTTSNIPLSTKVTSQIVNTPLLTKDSSLHEVITAMMSTKLYELPILENDSIIGVVTVKDIFSKLQSDKLILSFITECVNFKEPITHSSKGVVGDILPLLKNHGISRIILTNEKGGVEGITSRADLRATFVQPLDRQRYRGPAEDSRSTIFNDENKYRNDEPIERFMKTNVFTLPDSTSKKEVIIQLISSEFNSVVLVDKLNKPTGFLSIKDLIHCLGVLHQEITIPIVFKKPDDSVPESQLLDTEQKLENMIKKLSKIRPIQKVEIAVQVQKFANQKPSIYRTHINVDFPGQNAMATSEDKLYMKSVKDTIRDIEKQFLKTTKKN
jgi:predicted transcriptional regulator